MSAPQPLRKSAAPGFAGVAYEEAIARARALVPALRSRAAAAEAARAMSAETVADLHASGLIRTLQPKRWGGMEFDYVAYVDFPMELARGDASVGWNLANLQIHHWMLSLYDERAQEEVWGADPAMLIASGIAFPQGQGRRADGGFVVGGKWNFSSCVNIAEWNMLAVTVKDGDRAVDHRMCLLHKSQYQVIDDWKVMGMRSTGSMTATAKDVFVPEYKALCMYDTRGGGTFPGARVNANPAYRVSANALLGHGIGACAVGNARAALELSVEAVKQRSTSYTGAKMRDFQAVQLRIGAAAAKIDAAQLILRNDCIEGQELAARKLVPDTLKKLAMKRNLALAVGLCTEAVDALHAMAGANGIYEAAPLERIFRDAHSLAGHFSFSFDAQASAWGLAALGGEVLNPTL
jgi:3-hydroxy-9,10-secoandrosta-1,3,5(10)-triene-9,17-dione monooxygenase